MPGEIPYWGAGGIVDTVERPLFNEPLVLLGEDGAPFFEPGRDVAFLLEGPAWINNHIHVLRTKANVDRRYLVYALNCADYAAYISGSTRDKLTQDEMWNIQIPLHPINQQRSIADYLDRETARLDALIAAKTRLRILFEDRAESVSAAAIEHLSGTASAVPLAAIISPFDVTNAADREVLSVYRELGVIPKSSRSDNFNKTPDDLSKYQVVNVGDVVVNKMKAWQGSIAVSEYAGIVSPDYLVCRVHADIDGRYLNLVLRSPQLRGEFKKRSEGIRPNQWRLQWDQLRLVCVPIPARSDQEALSARLHSELRRAQRAGDLLSEQIGLLQEHRRALITAAVTGELDVPSVAA